MDTASLGPKAHRSEDGTRSEAYLPTILTFELASPLIDKFEIDRIPLVELERKTVLDCPLDAAVMFELDSTNGRFVGLVVLDSDADVV